MAVAWLSWVTPTLHIQAQKQILKHIPALHSHIHTHITHKAKDSQKELCNRFVIFTFIQNWPSHIYLIKRSDRAPTRQSQPEYLVPSGGHQGVLVPAVLQDLHVISVRQCDQDTRADIALKKEKMILILINFLFINQILAWHPPITPAVQHNNFERSLWIRHYISYHNIFQATRSHILNHWIWNYLITSIIAYLKQLITIVFHLNWLYFLLS